MYFRPLSSQMYVPSPLTMVGTGEFSYDDMRVKCIHRWS